MADPVPPKGLSRQRLRKPARLLKDGQPAEALALADHIHGLYPKALKPLMLGSRACFLLGDYQGAVERTALACALRPRNVEASLLNAEAVLRAGAPGDAFERVRRIERSAGQRAGALRRVAAFYEQFSTVKDAYRARLKALDLAPDDADILYGAARLARRLGRMREARALTRRLAYLKPDHAGAWALRSSLKVARPGAHNLEALGFLLEQHPEAGPRRAALCHALGRELEDLGQFEAAFTSYREAVDLSAPDVPVPRARVLDEAGLEAIERRLQPLAGRVPAGQADTKPPVNGPVFLVGLSCDGFELLHDLLDSHPGLQSLGAADPVRRVLGRWPGTASQSWDEAGAMAFGSALEAQIRDSCELTEAAPDRDALDPGAPQATVTRALDAAPGHFAHLGLLRVALPGARFIHLRREPLDQCLALFAATPDGPGQNSWNLEELAGHYTAYQRLMGHWRRHFPGALLEIDFEALLSAPGRVLGELSAFLALAPDFPLAAMNEPGVAPDLNAIGRKGLRPEEWLGRAGRFSDQLAPLAARLRANGVPVDTPVPARPV